MKHALITTLALLWLASPTRAADFDLERWLDEPDTKLVVVEFYADWCIPCQKAAPRWEALRRRYEDQGLKLVVVNIGEDKKRRGRCKRMPWNPDVALCDAALGDRLGVSELPEAFVWSWQGNLLVDRGAHVEEVEHIIRGYLDDNPRVQVVATGAGGKPDRALRRTVETELARWGKLEVVPDQEMRQRLAVLRKDSHAPGRRDDQRCKLGEEVSPNSLLQVERFEGAISLQLVDAASGCRRAGASEPIRYGRIDKAVQKAVFSLLEQMKRRPVPMPSNAPAASTKADPAPVTPEPTALELDAPDEALEKRGSHTGFAWYESTVGWSFSGVGLGLFIAGGVMYGLGAGERARLEEIGGQPPLSDAQSMANQAAEWQQISSRMETYDTVGIILFSVGAVSLVTGVISFIVEHEDGESPEADTDLGLSPRLQHITPTMLRDGAGLSMGLSF